MRNEFFDLVEGVKLWNEFLFYNIFVCIVFCVIFVCDIDFYYLWDGFVNVIKICGLELFGKGVDDEVFGEVMK